MYKNILGWIVLILVVMDVPLRLERIKNDQILYGHVLILVVMDVPLRLNITMRQRFSNPVVLILVVMDVPLRPFLAETIAKNVGGLNPCCNGCASQAFKKHGRTGGSSPWVLILVVMDVPLRLKKTKVITRK